MCKLIADILKALDLDIICFQDGLGIQYWLSIFWLVLIEINFSDYRAR
ncbi:MULTISPECIES: hypothetical protein [Bartonella]|nr:MULTISPECIES: hypothetical protein [Bartonella]